MDDFIDIRWRALKKRFGWDGVPKIQPYLGFSNAGECWIHGRVLTNPPTGLPEEDDSWWDNVTATLQRFNSDEVPDCHVEVQFDSAVHTATTDREGYFHLSAPRAALNATRGPWTSAVMRILDQRKVSPDESAVKGRILVPGENAKFGVISDVDDTIIETGATSLLTMAKMTFFANARTRLPLAGASQLYQAMHMANADAASDSVNPVFYVSSSPWNLFDVLESFLDLNDFPIGPILLRDLGFDDNKFIKEGHGHKLRKVRRLLQTYPDLPFVLIGDSGQEDARLYAEAAAEFQDRILAIFIRDIDPDRDSKRDRSVRISMKRAHSVGVQMYLVGTSTDIAERLHTFGLLTEKDVITVQAAVARESAESN